MLVLIGLNLDFFPKVLWMNRRYSCRARERWRFEKELKINFFLSVVKIDRELEFSYNLYLLSLDSIS